MTQVTVARSSVRPPHPEVQPSVGMSKRLWGITWPEWKLGGIDCVPSTFAEVEPFITEHYPSIFANEPDRFLREEMTPAKRRFVEVCCDTYIFRDQHRTVGVWIGNPVDWSSYYCRTIALLPQYRDRGLFNEFVVRLTEALRDVGVERLEGETAPTNLPMNRGLLALGWIVTASVNSERWGTMLRYTKFLTESSERCFRRQFIHTAHTESRPMNRVTKGRSHP
jgi:hypothetical protein